MVSSQFVGTCPKRSKSQALRFRNMETAVLCVGLYYLMVRLFCHRYLDLTEDEKEKLKGSYKVARKLEKLENMQDRCVLFSETWSWL